MSAVFRAIALAAALLCAGCASSQPTPTGVTPPGAAVRSVAERPAPRDRPSPRKYKVKLGRDLGLGERFHFVAGFSDRAVMRRVVDGKPDADQPEGREASVRAGMRVTKVAPNGEESAYEFVVESFTGTDSDGTHWNLPAGTTVTCDRAKTKDAAIILVEGKPPPQKLRDLLAELLPTTLATPPRNDALYGSVEPREIGETWEGSSRLMAQDFANSGIRVDPKDISTRTTLEGIRLGSGGELRLIHIELSIAGIQSIEGMPPGTTIDEASSNARIDTVVAPDGSYVDYEDATTLSFKSSSRLPTGEHVTVSRKSLRRSNSHFHPFDAN